MPFVWTEAMFEPVVATRSYGVVLWRIAPECAGTSSLSPTELCHRWRVIEIYSNPFRSVDI